MRRGWLADAVLVALFAALTAAVAAGWTHGLDLAVRDWVDSHRPQPAYVIARGLNYLGQAGPLTIAAGLLALALVRRAHSVRPLLPVIAAYAAVLLAVGPIKVLTDRAAPHAPHPHPEEFLSGGVSYPSGHAANIVVWSGVIVAMLAALAPAAMTPAARRASRVAPIVVVAVVTTYLGFHWLTDTVAGLIAGLLLARLLCRVRWDDVPLHRLPGGRRLAARGWFGKVPDLALR
jgi:membrane-associated phospholipid phosphatase